MSLAAGTNQASAGHVDSSYIGFPRLQHYFFSSFAPQDREIHWDVCGYIANWDIKYNAWSAFLSWQIVHGNGIKVTPTWQCSYPNTEVKVFGLTEANECQVENWQTIRGCRRVMSSGYNAQEGVPVWYQEYIYANAPYMQAFYNGNQKTHLFGHEFGHGMAIQHHSVCGYIMSTSSCGDALDEADVLVPRDLYGY